MVLAEVESGKSPRFALRDPAIFSILLLLATVIPTGFMIIANTLAPPGSTFFKPGVTALAFLGGGHVFITFWFYLDHRARGVMLAESWYYYLLPIGIMTSTSLAYWLLPLELKPFAYAAFNLSAQWHHARQNAGIYGFLCRAWRLAAPSRIERIVISLSFVGSIFVGLRWYELPTNTPGFNAAMYRVGLACFAVVLIAAACSAMREYARHRSPRRALLFAALSLFFLPALLFTSPGAAASFGAAHAIQYWLLLYYVVYRSPETVRAFARLPQSSAGWCIAIFVAAIWPVAILYGLALFYQHVNFLVGNRVGDGIDAALFGVIMGWVFTHYIIDAGVWKMSNARVRAYQNESFGFLARDLRQGA